MSMSTMSMTMAASLSVLFVLLLASSAAARPGLPFHPCNTLLISTYSVSFQPRNPDADHHRPEFFALVTEFREFRPQRPQFHPRGFIRSAQDQTLIRRPSLSLGSTTTMRQRTLDVLNVLSSLLFGAACGALTAATMYLIWSLFNTRFDADRAVDDFSDADDNDDEDDLYNPKKPANNHVYVALPTPPSAADSTETPLLNKESA